MKKLFKVILYTLIIFLLVSCSKKVEYDNNGKEIDTKTEEGINSIEKFVDCPPETVVKINQYFPGFYHDEKWYVPARTSYVFIEDLDIKEDIVLRERVISTFVESLQGCMIEGDISEGSYYQIPYNSRIVKTQEGEYFLCDQYTICIPMMEYDGIDRAPEIKSLKNAIDGMSKIMFDDGTVISSFKEVKKDLYIPAPSKMSLSAYVFESDDTRFFNYYRYLHVNDTDFFTLYDDNLKEAYSIYIDEENKETLDLLNDKFEEYYNSLLEQYPEGVVPEPEEQQNQTEQPAEEQAQSQTETGE